MHDKTILGIDLGTRYVGLAAIRGPALLAYGVHSLRIGTRPNDVIGPARRVCWGLHIFDALALALAAGKR